MHTAVRKNIGFPLLR